MALLGLWFCLLTPIPPEVNRALTQGQGAALYSIYPYRDVTTDLGQHPLPPGPNLYGHRVLGSTTLSAEEQRELLSALRWSTLTQVPLLSAGCFSPRHALVFQDSGHRYELLVCFQCGKSEVYRDGGRQRGWIEHGGYGADTFNRVLKAHGVRASPD